MGQRKDEQDLVNRLALLQQEGPGAERMAGLMADLARFADRVYRGRRGIPLLNPDHTINEVVSDLVLRVWQRKADMDPAFPLGAYLYSMLVGTSADEYHERERARLPDEVARELFSHSHHDSALRQRPAMTILAVLDQFFTGDEIQAHLPKALRLHRAEQAPALHRIQSAPFQRFYGLFLMAVEAAHSRDSVFGVFLGLRYRKELPEAVTRLIYARMCAEGLRGQVDERLLNTVDMASLLRAAQMYGGQSVTLPTLSTVDRALGDGESLAHYCTSQNGTAESRSLSRTGALTNEPVMSMVQEVYDFLISEIETSAERLQGLIESGDVENALVVLESLMRGTTTAGKSLERIVEYATRQDQQ